jgi:hypothetical protein
MLRCASSLVVATYEKVGLTPHDSRALPLMLFTKSSIQGNGNLYGNGYSWSSSKREEHVI